MAMNPTIFHYRVNLDERGEYSATVWDEKEEKVIYDISSIEQLNELTDDGFIRHSKDMSGLETYLMSMDILPANSVIIFKG